MGAYRLPTLVVAAIATFWVAAAAASTAAPGEKYSMLTMQEVSEMIGRPGVYIFDVNEPEIYEEHHLPGVVHIIDPHLKRYLPRDKAATIVFYCAERRCTASAAAAREAARLGYRNVYTMPEGIFGWVKAGLPFERGTQSRTAAK